MTRTLAVLLPGLLTIAGAARAETIFVWNDYTFTLDASYRLKFVPGPSHEIDFSLTGFRAGANNLGPTISGQHDQTLTIPTTASLRYTQATLDLSLDRTLSPLAVTGSFPNFNPTFVSFPTSELISVRVGSAAPTLLSGTIAHIDLLAQPGFAAELALGHEIEVIWREGLRFSGDLSGYSTRLRGAGTRFYTLRQNIRGPLSARFHYHAPEPPTCLLVGVALLAVGAAFRRYHR